MFENIRSKVVVKIGLLIIIETMFIISSFGTLAYFQSEGSSLGNSINIAGKNRYLTGNVLFEAEKYLESLSTTDLARLRAAIDNLDSNISVLKQGGKISGIELESLSSEFSNCASIFLHEKKYAHSKSATDLHNYYTIAFYCLHLQGVPHTSRDVSGESYRSLVLFIGWWP